MSFNGKYNLVDSQNFDEYLKAFGVGFMTRKVAGTTKPSIEITDAGDSVTIKQVSALKTTEVTYPIGQEIDEETADGRKCKSTMVRDGNSLVQTLKAETYTSTITRTLNADGLIALLKCGDVTSTRTYKRA